jgi:hypothetical protein
MVVLGNYDYFKSFLHYFLINFKILFTISGESVIVLNIFQDNCINP